MRVACTPSGKSSNPGPLFWFFAPFFLAPLLLVRFFLLDEPTVDDVRFPRAVGGMLREMIRRLMGDLARRQQRRRRTLLSSPELTV